MWLNSYIQAVKVIHHTAVTRLSLLASYTSLETQGICRPEVGRTLRHKQEDCAATGKSRSSLIASFNIELEGS